MEGMAAYIFFHTANSRSQVFECVFKISCTTTVPTTALRCKSHTSQLCTTAFQIDLLRTVGRFLSVNRKWFGLCVQIQYFLLCTVEGKAENSSLKFTTRTLCEQKFFYAEYSISTSCAVNSLDSKFI